VGQKDHLRALVRVRGNGAVRPQTRAPQSEAKTTDRT
jgi:hypothetical protein